MADTTNWLKDYAPYAAALAAIIIALFQYFVNRTKMNADRKKTEAETAHVQIQIDKAKAELVELTEHIKTNSDNISEIQNVLVEQLPMYSDETIVYNNTSGNLGFDFVGNNGKIWDGDKAITADGKGQLTFLDRGILNIDRDNTDGRYELYLRKYTLGAKTSEVIPKNPTDDKPKRFRVSCEARSIGGEHTVRFVMRDRESRKWFGRSIIHRLSSPEWKRIEAHFTVPPVVEAELRIDDEGVSAAPSTLQIRKLMMTQRVSD